MLLVAIEQMNDIAIGNWESQIFVQSAGLWQARNGHRQTRP
jgi:hypothetical protein